MYYGLGTVDRIVIGMMMQQCWISGGSQHICTHPMVALLCMK